MGTPRKKFFLIKKKFLLKDFVQVDVIFNRLFFLSSLRASHAAYGNSQVRVQIGAAAASLHITARAMQDPSCV